MTLQEDASSEGLNEALGKAACVSDLSQIIEDLRGNLVEERVEASEVRYFLIQFFDRLRDLAETELHSAPVQATFGQDFVQDRRTPFTVLSNSLDVIGSYAGEINIYSNDPDLVKMGASIVAWVRRFKAENHV